MKRAIGLPRISGSRAPDCTPFDFAKVLGAEFTEGLRSFRSSTGIQGRVGVAQKRFPLVSVNC
jgi:hypothetical protein